MRYLIWAGLFLLRFLKQLVQGEGVEVLGLLHRHSHSLSSTTLVFMLVQSHQGTMSI